MLAWPRRNAGPRFMGTIAMATKNTISLMSAFLAGVILATAVAFIARPDATPATAASATDQSTALESRLDKLDAKMSELSMDIATLSRTGLKLGDTAASLRGHATEVRNEPVTLTQDQKGLYEKLSQSIEYSPNTGFTMDELLKNMNDLPPAAQQKLLSQVTSKINSGSLNPKLFVEGSR